VLHAALAGNILLVRCRDELGGVLWFETTGLTSHLRYWYVNPALRNRGPARALSAAIFRHCAACRRFILWVIADNDDGIAKYEHYGYRRESLVDRIMINRGESRT